jgi:hypothetical protein
MRRALAKRGVWHVLRLCSLSTLFREYIAVHALAKVPFAPVLLAAASPAPPQQQSLVIPQVALLPFRLPCMRLAADARMW